MAISRESEEVKSKYTPYLKDSEYLDKNPIRCSTIYEDLKPGYDFLVKLGLNTVRPYTLASWDQDKTYIDLVVSIDPLGLASNYFKSNPTELRILPSSSSFYVPENRPIVMVANGTGIAPFRSLVKYVTQNMNPLPKMRLYMLFYLDISEFRTKQLISISMMNGCSLKRNQRSS